ncbi:MAG: alpha/beta hydrolase [Flavobacteriaceae bacterium]|nr:alpha/beta hydrolase [Bacteroidia bacterium]NNK87468.1 alpha/beta hydrolase [Flavobacteriaceae bacterium]
MKNLIAYKAGHINFEDRGKGQAVVMLHGFLEDLSMWKNLTDDLLDAYRVIAIDLPGHGSTDGFGAVHSMEDMAEVVNTVVRALDLNKIILIGHSMGGYAALAYSELFAENVLGLCLLNSTSKPDSEEKKQNRDRAAEAALADPGKFVSMLIPNLFDQNNKNLYRDEINQLIKSASIMTGANIAAALYGMRDRPDRESVLRGLGEKAMVVVGLNDPVLDHKSILDQTKSSEIRLVELDGGHMSFIESLEDLSYFFMRFIEKL